MTRDELELLTADEEQRRALPVMGSLADQSISPHEIAAARVVQAARPAAGRQEGWLTENPDFGMVVPRSPLDVALLAAGGPLSRAAKVGALAVGGALSSDEAQAGPSNIIRKGLQKIADESGALGGILKPKAEKTLFDYSRLHEVPDVPQFGLPRYEPPRGTSERVQDLVQNKKVEQQMLELMASGEKIGAEKFYNNDPLRQAFIDELGKKQGPQAFSRYMDYVAATSPRSKVPENVRNASYYYVLDKQGNPMPVVGATNPQPYGHMAQRLHQQNAQTVAGPGWDVMQNPKPASFSQNLQGNFAPVTVDAHAFKAPAMLSRDPEFLATAIKLEKGKPTINPTEMFASKELSMKEALQRPVYWASKPNKNEYGAMEQYYQRLAQEAGLPAPAMGQAASWAGGGELTGLGSVAGDPFLRSVEQRAVLTAKERGITPSEALSQFIRGKKPLLSLPPATVGALAAQDQYQRE